MKLIKHFDTFLNDTVNLNDSRIELLEQRIESISKFLRGSDYKPRIRRFAPQGSWAHKTIIKPPKEKDFDADLVIFIDEFEEWEPADYVTELHRVFKENGIYKDKASLETRCVTIDYANDFHLDVIPCIQDIEDEVYSFRVCNRVDDEFEPTDPEEYNSWLEEKNTTTGKNSLRKVTRLIKYLRDVKGTFSVKSILLTTLLGERIFDRLDLCQRDTCFCDLPTSLKTLFGRLDDHLQRHSNMISVTNPVLPEEEFTRHWDDEKYQNFREKIHEYRQWIDDAYNEPDRDESIRKWRRVFGEEFAEGEVVEKAANTAAQALRPDIVDAIRRGAKYLLDQFPTSWPHVFPSRWRNASYAIPVIVTATEHLTEHGELVGNLSSGTIVKKGHWICFDVKGALPETFSVMWRVVNTGEEAGRKKGRGLRGGFYSSNGRTRRWEGTEYTGVHWVEAFVILISLKTQPTTRTC